MLNGWMAGSVAIGLVAAAAATVYLTNRAQAAPTQPTAIVHAYKRGSADKRALVAELERDGYRCISGQLFKKSGNEWRQLGRCPIVGGEAK